MSEPANFIDYRSKKALVIDDFPGMRSAFKMALASFGMTKVDLASTASEAIMRVKNLDYDVIISDYNLGEGRDGQQLLEEIRHRNLIGLETVFLMVTAESVYERVVAAAELAPDDYLIKPFNGEILRTRLDAILTKKEAFKKTYRDFAQGNLESALANCEALKLSHPKYYIDAMRFKGEILVAMGDFEAAEALYKLVIELRAVPWSRLGLARSLYLQRKTALAEPLLQDIINQNPGLVAGYDLLADVQLEQIKQQQAQCTLVRGVGVSAKSPRRQRRLGEVAYQNNDLSCAENAFKSAIDKGRHSIFLAPNDYANLSRVYLDQNNVKAATEVVTENRKLLQDTNEGKLVSAVIQGQICARKGNHEEAKVLMEEAMQIRSMGVNCQPELMLDMVEACVKSGMDDAAATLLEEVARNSHDSTNLLDKAKRIYRDVGNEEKASEILKKSTERVTKLSKEGALLLQKGELQKGVEMLIKAAEEAPRNPRVLMNTAWAILKLIEREGRSTRAFRMLNQAKRLLDDAVYVAPDHPRVAGLKTLLRSVETLLTAQ